MSKALKPIVWVATDEALRSCCEHWLTLPLVAIDTEFMRTDTYYPEPALLQVFDGEQNTLIDPLAVEDFEPLKRVLTEPGVVKALHACSEDIEVFSRLLGVVPTPLFDTQIASAFCGLGYSRGYAALVEILLHTNLPKEETRSDWLQRPLTEAQTEYAACDVEYLFRIYHILHEQLTANGRLAWVLEDCQTLVAQVLKMQAPAEAYQRYKGAWRLAPRNLALLMHLASWREQLAQHKNIPRGRIVDNKSLYTIAEKMPKHIAQLRNIDTMREGMIRRYGEQLVAMVQVAAGLGQKQLPTSLTRPPTGEAQKKLKRLRLELDTLAQTMAIAPEALANRRDLETLVSLTDSDPAPLHLTGWRAPILEQAMKSTHEQTDL